MGIFDLFKNQESADEKENELLAVACALHLEMQKRDEPQKVTIAHVWLPESVWTVAHRALNLRRDK